jgi:hypothetical protein
MLSVFVNVLIAHLGHTLAGLLAISSAHLIFLTSDNGGLPYIVYATLTAAPPATKTKDGERDPEMHQPNSVTIGTLG